MALFRRRPPIEPIPEPTGPPRLLFLDDDPARAEAFQLENPDAVWVQTVAECLGKLVENWDEVHLDHDLGGEVFVDTAREDCGMEVVRWLTLEPRPHLKPTRFFIHSHNANASTLMGWQLLAAGFTVKVRPFGATEMPVAEDHPEDDWVPETFPRQSVFDYFRAFFQNDSAARADDMKGAIDAETPPDRE
jgi:hypothetical protein